MDRAPRSGRVTVAVLTFRRPDDLTHLIPMLLEQATSAAVDGWATRVLVVDNNPGGTARRQVERLGTEGAQGGVDLVYAHEPVANIAAARNRALDACAHDDVLVFIDDDERPSARWLRVMLDTWEHYGRPAAVVGPVVSSFEVDPETWVRVGRFFDRRRPATGTEVSVAATNNLLLDLRVIRAAGLRFDLDFGVTGGDDTMFTKLLSRAGERMVWCAEAGVVDVVPAERITRRWVLQRAFSTGNSWSLTSVKCESGFLARLRERLRLTLQGLLRLTAGGGRWMLGCGARRISHRASGLRTVARGVGMIAGAWGIRYLEYRRSPA